MRQQLNIVALAISSMVVLAFIVPLGILIRDQTADRALAGAQRDAQSIATAFAVVGSISDANVASVASAVIDSLDPSGRVSVVLDDGTVIGAQFELEDSNLAAARGGNAFTAQFEYGAEVLVPVDLETGSRPVVRSFVTTAELREDVVTAWLLLAGLGVALIAASLMLADRLGRSIVGPVRQIAAATREFGHGQRSIRLPDAGPPEVAEVAIEFNHLADRLDGLLAAERESVADLSHRLRTPLAALRLQAEALPDAAASMITPEVERLDEAVTQLIEQARSSSYEPRTASTDLAAAVRHRIAFWRVLAADQGRQMDVASPSAPVMVPLDSADIGAAIDTLIENVFAHTPPGTAFSVQLTTGSRGPTLLVEDAGPGFHDPGGVERGASGSGSTGLGLDIVRRCVTHTGGRLVVQNRTTGGARVRVEFGIGA
ncbi:MAG: HAMP domain-containing histidine kinase [Acidimicrobiia bacterium]|nr:HAMP domain-containing histidine kinase [Acidimicrobiia bacterium]